MYYATVPSSNLSGFPILKPTYTIKYKDYSLWWCNVQQVSFFIPGILINNHISRIFLKNKRPILINHANQTRTSRPTIKPKNKWIIIRITLWIKKNIMESTMSKIKITYKNKCISIPEYQRCPEYGIFKSTRSYCGACILNDIKNSNSNIFAIIFLL